MFEHLRRLATTGSAYTASSVLSKLIAIFLLPVYTAYLSPADYGAAEVMLACLVAASIVVRLGVIEAILRFYYLADEDPRGGRQDRVRLALLDDDRGGAHRPALRRSRSPRRSSKSRTRDSPSLAILGLWQLTLWEYVLTLLRLDERAQGATSPTRSSRWRSRSP